MDVDWLLCKSVFRLLIRWFMRSSGGSLLSWLQKNASFPKCVEIYLVLSFLPKCPLMQLHFIITKIDKDVRGLKRLQTTYINEVIK